MSDLSPQGKDICCLDSCLGCLGVIALAAFFIILVIVLAT